MQPNNNVRPRQSVMEHEFKHEQLPSGKMIFRHFCEGSLVEEHHTYGVLDIGIKYDFTAGIRSRRHTLPSGTLSVAVPMRRHALLTQTCRRPTTPSRISEVR